MKPEARIGSLVCSSLLALAGCGADFVGQTSEALTEVHSYPFNEVAVCGATNITLSGTAQDVFHLTQVDDSHCTIKVQFNYKGVKGVDQNGTRYVAADSDSVVITSNGPCPAQGDFPADAPWQVSFSEKSRFVSVGGGALANYIFTAFFHMTVNANGTVAVVRETARGLPCEE